MQQVVILGATGSIGTSTLDVIGRHPDHYQVFALTANQSVEDMAKLCRQFRPAFAVMGDERAADNLRRQLTDISDTEVLWGEAAMVDVAQHNSVDVVMAAIVGFAGLRPALAAAQSGKRLLLANKEALVSAGRVFMSAVVEGGATLLPIDSEHNAMFQCLPVNQQARPDTRAVEKILLTASGGPFRGRSREQLHGVSPNEACAHPNWSMGRKISVDSATLMNKGLELAEACWLFDARPRDIDVVVHPESVIHSLIRYCDGSVLAQLGNPDMRTPIAYGLAWPARIDAGVEPLDLFELGQMHFEKPNTEAFPCLRLAQEAIEQPGGMCVLNAANELAVAAFLAGDIRFTDIDRIIASTLGSVTSSEPETLTEVEELDQHARTVAQESLNRLAIDGMLG